ncbi:hypothetical protein DRO59_01810 [Candidatus Bathyarchaeota archaeon]|nr:MAG: hypothetical protein DRO59_01810 [Candidatus Bathyarchaeota archaeon]
MFAYGIFKVIYSPYKAFKEIIEKPSYIGPVLIMILFIIANTGFAYVFLSKAYADQTMPPSSELDKWTEDTAFWDSNASRTFLSSDCINGTYYGNSSIAFSKLNSSQVWMRLNITDPLNCSGSNGYKNLSFRVKWTSPEAKPNNVSIYLLSTNSTDYFYSNLTKEFVNSAVNVWNNITLALETESWTGSADWGNIAGLKLSFTWSRPENITVLIDGLFFHGVFKPLIETSSSYLFNYSLFAFMQFTMQWVVLGGLLYILSKLFGGKAAWRTLLTIAGFALITLFIQALASAVTYTALPTIRYPLEILGGVPGEGQAAYNQIAEASQFVLQINQYIQIIIHIWTIALCTIALRLLFEYPWLKSAFISALAYLLSLFVITFLTGY